MNFSQSCPDAHYRCPGEFNDCLPVYTRCNGMYDCIDHQDEEGCGEITCPGFFRCRASTIYLHTDHLCDGWPHCPLHEDEMCSMTCPEHCLCRAHTFLCPQPFQVTLYPAVRFLDATGSGMTLSDVQNHTYLIHLILAECSLARVPSVMLFNLMFLDLTANKLRHVNMTSFFNLENLRTLYLASNPLTSLHNDFSNGFQHSLLTVLDLSHTPLTVFDANVLAHFSSLRKLNLTLTSIHTITPDGFQPSPQLVELHMDGSPLKTFPPHVLKSLSSLQIITTGNYKLCCKEMLPYHSEDTFCKAPKVEISSCKDLLQSWTYRGSLWLVAVLSVTGNVFCFCARVCLQKTTRSSGFSVFITSLTIADFLMGVYIAIVGAADEWFRGRYLHHDDAWKNSVTCKVAGFLSLLSSEVSALIIWLITLDRFVVIRFPFRDLRFGRTSATIACVLTWLVGWSLALMPLLPVTAHWEFYSQTGICIPLPVTKQSFRGKAYSFGLFIVLNFILFLLTSAGQACIFWSIQKNVMKTNTTRVTRDMTIARRLITIAVTDFLCWFPIGLCGLLALTGTSIPGEVNVGLAIFVLPLNSAINPFLYTINTFLEKRQKAYEAKLLRWMMWI